MKYTHKKNFKAPKIRCLDCDRSMIADQKIRMLGCSTIFGLVIIFGFIYFLVPSTFVLIMAIIATIVVNITKVELTCKKCGSKRVMIR